MEHERQCRVCAAPASATRPVLQAVKRALIKSKSHYDRRSVGQSVVSEWVNLRPTVRRPSGTCDQFFFLLEISFRHLRVCKFVAPSLTRGRICKLLYNCFWALPEQSFLGRSPAELTALFYCLIWDSTDLEGQVPVFRSHVSGVRRPSFIRYQLAGTAEWMLALLCSALIG
jgi:hypothetical protein